MRLDVICFRFWMRVFGHVNTRGLGYPAKLSLHFSLGGKDAPTLLNLSLFQEPTIEKNVG